MNVLLLIGKTSTSHEAVAAEADDLRRQGHHVTLGTRVPPLPVLTDAVDVVVLLSPALPAPTPPAAPTGEALATAAATAPAPQPVAAQAKPAAQNGLAGTARRRVRKLRGQVSGAITEPARSWRSVRRNPALLEIARAADVIVAVDAPMVRATWHLGDRLPLPTGPEVVYGLPATASALARRAARA